jgi:hypothetical protein
MAFKDPQSGASLDKGQFKKLEGKRLGQTKLSSKPRRIGGVTVPAGYYVKAGNLYKYDADKDSRIESKYCMQPGQPGWRADPCKKGEKKPLMGPASQFKKRPRLRSI